MKIMSFNTQHCLNYIERRIDFDVMAKAIADCGAEVVALMAEMVESDEYLKLYNLSDAYNETINQVREGDYSTPSAIFELTIPDDELFDEEIDEKIFVNDLYIIVNI